MDVKLKKYLLWALVMMFAFLQALSPLLHAHIKGDNIHSTASFHVHVLPDLNDVKPVLKNVVPSEFADVNQSILRNISLDILAAYFVLVTFLVRPKVKLFFIDLFKNPQVSLNVRHRRLIPRAPPSF